MCYLRSFRPRHFTQGQDIVLRYRDFVPKRTGAAFLKFKPEFESFDDAVMAANDWIHEESIDVF